MQTLTYVLTKLTYVLTKANVNNTLHILLLYTFKYLIFGRRIRYIVNSIGFISNEKILSMKNDI